MEDIHMTTGTGKILSKDFWVPDHLGVHRPDPQYQRNIEIWNYSAAYVSVAERSGLNYLLKPMDTSEVGRCKVDGMPRKETVGQPGLYIRYTSTIPYYENVDPHLQVAEMDSRDAKSRENGSTLGKTLMENTEIKDRPHRKTVKESQCFIFVPLDDIISARGAFYLRDLDLFLSTKYDSKTLLRVVMENQDDMPHPYSEECVTLLKRHQPKFRVETEGNDPLPSIGIHLVQIDNSNSGKRFYANIAKGLVTEVPRVKRPDMKDGFWFFFSDKDWSRIDELFLDPTAKYFPLEEAQSDKILIKCFESANEALIFGDRETEQRSRVQDRQEELSALEHENLKLKKKVEELKDLANKQKIELEREDRIDIAEMKKRERQWEEEHRKKIDELEAEKAKLKAELEEERERRKDYYEQRSQDRKDSSETWKWVTGVVTAGIAIVVAVCKWLL